MSFLILSTYILVWPALTLWVLVVLCRAVLKDYRSAKKNNEEMV